MQSYFIGQVAMYGGGTVPSGWALCDGKVLPIAENEALFSLIGSAYGGDGRTTFALPDFRGRSALSPGSGLSQGKKVGAEQRTMTLSQMPEHNHEFSCSSALGDQGSPADAVPAAENIEQASLWSDQDVDAMMHPEVVQVTGSGAPISLREPYTGVNFMIATSGIYPSRWNAEGQDV